MPARRPSNSLKRLAMSVNEERRDMEAKAKELVLFEKRLKTARKQWEELQAIADNARDLYLSLESRYETEIHNLVSAQDRYARSLVKGHTDE